MEKPKVHALSAIIIRLKEHMDKYIKGKIFWVKASVSQVRFDARGHGYLTLHETAADSRMVQCAGRMWQTTVMSLRKKLGSDFDNIIRAGNEIVALVEIEFNEFYGLSAIVKDIDIDFNLSQLEKNKKHTLEQLTRQGLLDTNKAHVLPPVIQRIALVGSANTNGVNDFIKELTENKHGYRFSLDFYPCTVQGPSAENEIVTQLDKIGTHKYDLVVLIRGGGSALDLEVFNSYRIARAIATHPLPVHTGIGHEFDFSVADRVAHRHHKTPTAVGSFLLARSYQFEVRITNCLVSCLELTRQKMHTRKTDLKSCIEGVKYHGSYCIQWRRAQLHAALNRINSQARHLITQEQNRLVVVRETIQSAPVFSLARRKQALKANLQLLSLHSAGRISQVLDSNKQNLQLAIAFSQRRLSEQGRQMESLQSLLMAYHPANVLSKGYAIVRYQKTLLSTQSLQTGEQMEIELYNRTLLVSYIADKPTDKQPTRDRQHGVDQQEIDQQETDQQETDQQETDQQTHNQRTHQFIPWKI